MSIIMQSYYFDDYAISTYYKASAHNNYSFSLSVNSKNLFAVYKIDYRKKINYQNDFFRYFNIRHFSIDIMICNKST
jgi:hypothetical protein